jgi:hypothetical protein
MLPIAAPAQIKGIRGLGIPVQYQGVIDDT